MACLFIDDGTPEAAEYESNYIEFDENNPDDFRRVKRIARLVNIKSAQPDSFPSPNNLDLLPLFHSLSKWMTFFWNLVIRL